MTDSPETSGAQTPLADGDRPAETPAGGAWPPAPPDPQAAASTDQHPELLVGAAFAGGLLTAMILKRLAN